MASDDDFSWVEHRFQFDDRAAERDDIRDYCRQHDSEVGSFFEIGTLSMAYYTLPSSAPGSMSIYMCTHVESKTVGYLRCPELRFTAMRHVDEFVETNRFGHPLHAEEWERAASWEREVFETYARYVKNHCRAPISPPFFDSSPYSHVVQCISVHPARPSGISRPHRFRTTLTVEHRVTSDITQEHILSAARGESAIFQADSHFNCLELEEHTLPSDGIRRYAKRDTQAKRCAMATPVAALARNWLLNSDDVQLNGLSAVLQMLQMYDAMEVVNGSTVLSHPARQSLENGRRIWNSEAVDEHVRLHLRIGFSEVESAGIRNAWCATVDLRGLSPNQKKTLRPFAQSVLFESYRLTLRAAAFHPSVDTVYLTVLGVHTDTDESMVIEAMNKAISQYRQTPLQVIILHENAFHEDVKAQVATAEDDEIMC
jgi:hypothetical protein